MRNPDYNADPKRSKKARALTLTRRAQRAAKRAGLGPVAIERMMTR